MGIPTHCTNQDCRWWHSAPRAAFAHDGWYTTAAHGQVQRYRCRACGKRLSRQSESIHYFAKRRLPLREIFERVRGGSSLRDIARCIGCSRTAVATAVMRIGRQAMSAQSMLVSGLQSCRRVSFDGLLSSVGSKDYPAHLTVLADAATELVLTMTHSVTLRAGRRTATQERRLGARAALWKPTAGALSESISLLINELPHYWRPAAGVPLLIDTDEHPLYLPLLKRDLAVGHLLRHRLARIRQTPGSAPRTVSNPLFALNYIDRMLRHRLREHTRQSITFARNSTMQMHRAWLFAWDHNAYQPHRVRRVSAPTRFELAGVPASLLNAVRRSFFTRRINLSGVPLPQSMRLTWCAAHQSPPLRWAPFQIPRRPEVPAFVHRDLARSDHHAQ